MNFFRAISNILRFDRTNWKALALCFLAAAVFWIFNALNKDYSTNLRFPLQVEFDQSKFIAVTALPSDLLLNVSGNGWEILRKSLGLKVPGISMPLERPTEIHKVAASSLAPIVASQLGFLQLNYIVTDTLHFAFETRLSRKIKLIPDIKAISFKKTFGRIGPVAVLPDSILLEGPRSMIEGLSDTLSFPVKATRISSNFRENVEVKIVNNELVSRNPPVVQVVFAVGPVEELTVNARLDIPRGTGSVEVDRDSVRCVFRLPQKEHERFVQESAGLFATISSKELKKGDHKFILPSLNRDFSSYAELVQIDSVKVKKY